MSKSARTILFSSLIFAILITACFPEGTPGSGTPGDGSPTPPGGGVGTLPGDLSGPATPVPGAGTPHIALPSLIFVGTLPFLDIGTLPPSATATPWFHVIIIVDVLCYMGPGPDWNVVGAIKKGTMAPVVGRSSDQQWLVLSYFALPCWIKIGQADTGDNNTGDLPPVEPGPRNTKTPTATKVPREGCWLFGPKGEQVCVVPCPSDDKVPRGWQKGDACTP